MFSLSLSTKVTNSDTKIAFCNQKSLQALKNGFRYHDSMGAFLHDETSCSFDHASKVNILCKIMSRLSILFVA